MPRPISNTKAGETDLACIKASLDVRGLVKIGDFFLNEKDLYTRIIDKIPGDQFHKIIMAILADYKKEYTRAKRSIAAKRATPKRLYTLKKNKEHS